MNESKDNFASVDNKLDKVLNALQKPKKSKTKPAPIRDIITDTIFNEIMHTKKPVGV